MNYQRRIIIPADVKTWTHDGDQPPDWVKANMVGERHSNGAIMLSTNLGQARALPGQIVISHHSGIWVREPGEVPELIAGFEAEEDKLPAAIGPGKAGQFGAKSKSSRSRGALPRSTPFKPPVGQMPSIEWKFTKDLRVDPSYQRSIDNEASRRLIASIAANFDWRLCPPLVLSKRPNDDLIVIDGQHRWAAAVRRGDLLQLPCCVFSYGSPEEEARLFIVANRARKAMSRLDDFYAAVAAADEDALEIAELVAQAGLTVARSVTSQGSRPNEIAFTSSIAYALRRNGAQAVSAALTTMAEVFSGQVLFGPIFSGLADLFANPPEDFDPDKLALVLSMKDSREWYALARDASTPAGRTLAMRDAVLKETATV
jgi:hypothetical protein